MNKIQVNMLVGECWYCMDVSRGLTMPIDKNSQGEIDLVGGVFKNQSAPFLISNHGRYIWCEDGFKLSYSRGKMVCVNEPSKHSIDLYQGFGTLKSAYLDASSKYFPPSETYPSEDLFRDPLYCTFAWLREDQTEENIIKYARSIIEAGMKPGVLTIDYGWQVETGTWDFDLTKIPQPKMMVEKLHKMGFKVRLWICPFVSEKSKHYRYLKYGDMLVVADNGKLARRCWSHGKDLLLDVSNPDAEEWICSKLDELMNNYGIDGFKFEGGEPNFYRNNDITYNAVDAVNMCALWNKIAAKYDYNEVRSCFKSGGKMLSTRLYNKHYRFKNGGLDEVVPCILMQGILGYPYGCPDMVGGSEIDNGVSKRDNGRNMELLIRFAEASALMPMVQYSLPIWDMENSYVASLCKGVFDLHEKYVNYIMSLVKNASKTGEPVIRYLEYEFPHQGFHKVNNMFMLGSRYLVAPIVDPDKYKLTIRLPKGLWQYVDSKIYEGEVTVDAPLEVLPVFEKIR